MIGDRFPAWALALCGGLVLAVIVAMTTRSDKQPWGHFVSTPQQDMKLQEIEIKQTNFCRGHCETHKF